MDTIQPPPRPFRTDIAGLRAIAVTAVVLYHFGIPGVHGGFSGVDIFFVISGFLMTGIITKGIDRGTFSVLEFYLARARRIIPALVALCTVLMIGGWFLLIPYDYAKLGGHVASSIGFVSNLQYWREPGYFNTQSQENWLLHTWSLSVEWQFYLIFPIFMVILRKLFSASMTRWLLIAVALVSLVISIYVSPRWSAAAFYTPPTRAWELLAGGLVFLFPISLSNTVRRVLEIGGITLLAVSIFTLSAADVWPGSLALLPVVGTVLMLLAANQRSPVTGTRLSQSLGNASYSIYLWHWPIAVYLKYYHMVVTPGLLAAAIGLAVALGYVSYHLIERPTRNMGIGMPRLQALSGYATVGACVLALSLSILLKHGYEERASDAVNLASQEASDKNPLSDKCAILRGVQSPKCVFGDPGAKVSVIVLGDSHADATVSSVVAAAGAGKGTLFLGYMGCLSVPDIKLQGTTASNQCGQFMHNQMEALKTEYPGVPIVVTNRTSVYVMGHNEQADTWTGPMGYFGQPSAFNDAYKKEFTRHYVAGICELSAHRPVYITAPIPEIGVDVPSTLARTLFRTGVAPDLDLKRQDYDQRNAFARSVIDTAAKECGAVVLDPTDYLCNGDTCNTVVDGRPLYFDDNHLSEFGNKELVPMYRQIWATTDSADR